MRLAGRSLYRSSSSLKSGATQTLDINMIGLYTASLTSPTTTLQITQKPRNPSYPVSDPRQHGVPQSRSTRSRWELLWQGALPRSRQLLHEPETEVQGCWNLQYTVGDECSVYKVRSLSLWNKVTRINSQQIPKIRFPANLVWLSRWKVSEWLANQTITWCKAPHEVSRRDMLDQGTIVQ